MRWTLPLNIVAGLVLAGTWVWAAPEAQGRARAAISEVPDAAYEDANDAAPARISVGAALDLIGNPVNLFVPVPKIGLDSAASPYLSVRSGLFPVSSRHVTSGFGQRSHPVLGGMRQHLGIDLAAPSGSPVLATMDGIVGQAGAFGNYGLLVGVKAPAGLETRYAHLSRVNVVPGQAVRRGQVLGWSGTTGLSTGPHLHYEVRINGRATNPFGR